MRKLLTFGLLFTFLLTSALPSFAQKTGEDVRRLVTAADFESVKAISDGGGVLVRWQMRSERQIAVYDVYRIQFGEKVLISPVAVQGSYSRFGNEVVYDETYNFFDLEGDVGTTYAVEARGLDGRRFGSKETAAVAVKSVENEVGISSETFRNTRSTSNSNLERSDATISGELRDIVSLHTQEPNPEMQRVIASRPGVKIAVKKDGFYRVSANELQAQNFPINSDSSKWRLFMNGNEQAITVGPDNSYIDFYGSGMDTPETDRRQYFLIADTVAGKRIGTKILRQRPGAAAAANYRVAAGKKERFSYEPRILNYEEENFYGRYLVNEPTLINFNLTGVDQSASARIRVTLMGYAEYAFHRFTVKVNGNPLPDITQYGRVSMWTDVTIPGSHLGEGTNVLELVSSGPQDSALFDKVEVTYQRKYVAEQSKISFTTPGDRKVDLEGFSTSGVRVYDLSFEGNPVLLLNVPVVEGTSGFTAKIPSSRPMVAYAVEDAGLMQAAAVVKNDPSTLSAISNNGRMIIISHSTPAFMNEVQAWKAFRESPEGGSIPTMIVDIADIFDEFSYGEFKHGAIKEFLNYAVEEWAGAPLYVMFVGDATFDPRNYEGYGFNNLIPSAPTRFIIEESYSDDALVDFDDDGLADLSIGRIPARSATQITTALNRVKKFEQNQLSFNRGSLFAYDSALDYDFEGMSQILSNELPPGAPRFFIQAGSPNSNSSLIAKINEGMMFINYSGHGASGLWSSTNFFSILDVSALTNANNPSIFSMLTCMNGYFLRTNADSLSESLIFQPGGGASAAWASTSLTTPDVQLIMAQTFLREMAVDLPGEELDRIGPLIKKAKATIPHGADVRLSWVLIGDPAMRTP